MRKVIAAINMTLDGYCDHTAVDPDDEIHQHYADLLKQAGTTLYGRITYELMEYWPKVVAHPTGNQATDDFAQIMDQVPKIVFSNTLTDLTWHSAKLARQTLEQEVLALKQQSGKEVLVGSRSLIIQLTKLNLIDEFQLCVHPVVAGGGLPLFKGINERALFNLVKTKTFTSGAVLLYYKPATFTGNSNL